MYLFTATFTDYWRSVLLENAFCKEESIVQYDPTYKILDENASDKIDFKRYNIAHGRHLQDMCRYVVDHCRSKLQRGKPVIIFFYGTREEEF